METPKSKKQTEPKKETESKKQSEISNNTIKAVESLHKRHKYPKVFRGKVSKDFKVKIPQELVKLMQVQAGDRIKWVFDSTDNSATVDFYQLVEKKR